LIFSIAMSDLGCYPARPNMTVIPQLCLAGWAGIAVAAAEGLLWVDSGCALADEPGIRYQKRQIRRRRDPRPGRPAPDQRSEP